MLTKLTILDSFLVVFLFAKLNCKMVSRLPVSLSLGYKDFKLKTSTKLFRSV